MPRKPIRVGLVGAGNMAVRYHGPALGELSAGGRRLELRAVCDLDRERAESFAASCGFREVYDDLEKMLDAEKLDAVWVLTRPVATPAVVTQVVRRKLPCFMEKPPAKDLAEARRLARTVGRYKALTQVSFNRRFVPLMVKARELVLAEGPVKAVQCHFYRCRRLEPDFNLGTGIHGIDALRWIAGEVAEVTCEVRDFFPGELRQHERKRRRAGGGRAFFATLRFRGGAVGQVSIIPASGIDAERYVIHGEECVAWVHCGQAWVADYPGSLTFHKRRHEVLRADHQDISPLHLQPMRVAGFLGASESFVRCLETGQRPQPDVASAVRSMEVAAAIQKGGTRRFRARG